MQEHLGHREARCSWISARLIRKGQRPLLTSWGLSCTLLTDPLVLILSGCKCCLICFTHLTAGKIIYTPNCSLYPDWYPRHLRCPRAGSGGWLHIVSVQSSPPVSEVPPLSRRLWMRKRAQQGGAPRTQPGRGGAQPGTGTKLIPSLQYARCDSGGKAEQR